MSKSKQDLRELCHQFVACGQEDCEGCAYEGNEIYCELEEAIDGAHNAEHERAENVTRVEVIDDNGRSYVHWQEGSSVKLDYQDDGRTLKIFISNQGK